MNRRSRFLVVASLLLGLALSSMARAEKPMHLFIFFGQSNMAAMDPEAGFMPEARKLFPDAEVVYAKVADRGQPIRFWVSEWNQIAKKHDLAVPFDPKNKRKNFYQPILAEYKALLEKHPKPASVTFCSMQGERDAMENLSAGYADALRQLIANLRRDLKQPAANGRPESMDREGAVK